MYRFRELFGSFSDSSITFKRTFSKESMAKVRQVIAENFPQAEARRAAHERNEKEDLSFTFSTEGMNPDAQKLKKMCGFVYPKPENFDDTEAGKKAYYEASRKYQDFSSEILNCLRYDGKMNYNILLEFLRERYKIEDEQPKQQTEKEAKTDRSEKAAKSGKASEDVDMTAAPADGLELVEIAEGVAVVGDQSTTYKNRKAIKAHGARWNKDAQQWQATTAEAVAQLREWFGMTEQSAADAETCEQVEAVGVLASALSFLVGAIVSATEKANEALKQAAASAVEATANYEAEHRAEERKEAAAILREQIKKVSEQVANLSDTLAQMQERFNALESGQDESEETAAEPQTDETAQDGTATQQGETTAQSRPKGGSGSGVSLDMLRAAAEDVERLTDANEHGRAALAELYTLCACGVDVRDLIDELRELNTSEALGNKPAGEIWAKHSQIRRCARNRAKVVLSTEQLEALYTWNEGTEAGNGKAA